VEVRGEQGDPLAIVTDDEVSVMDGRRLASRFRELEVELDSAAPEGAIDDLLARLRDAGAGPVDNVPKLRRALGARASEPPEVVPPEVGEGSSVADVVRRAIAVSVVRLLRHDAGVRLGEDPEDVHQARVATRRIRSDLRTFRDVVDPEWALPLREELAWLGGQLGAVRDAEVLRDRLRGREPLLPPDDRPAIERLLATLDGTRAEARERLVAAMREPRYVTLLDALVEGARAPRVLDEHAGSSASTALRPSLEAPWRHLEAATERVREDPTDEALHAARIRAKRVRYAAEAVAPVFGKRAKAFALAAVGLQDVLGEHQDAVVAGAWLRDAAKGSAPRAFAAGQLAAIEAGAARAARDAWPAAWKALSRKKLRFWA
jgi:CHAD domain-containing protein